MDRKLWNGCVLKGTIQAPIVNAAKTLGYSELREHPKVAVKHFFCREDVFVSLSTRSCMSLCYCLLPKASDILRESKSVDTQSVVIVVSPLITLMKDQVRQMTEKGVSALYVGETDETTVTEVCEGKYQLVYISPEALLTNSTWRDMSQSPIYQNSLVALVVDEAHCVKKW